ncbi:speckle-type POZ protein homolog [Bolinopsis microptera]|uniref:speckle-type POZ protein homolog n=1 Tax=Bolinopsis microptera TaxID=2820187 RepID=UPI00307A503B
MNHWIITVNLSTVNFVQKDSVKILMKIVWEVKNIVKILTEKVTSGNTKGVNLESPSFSLLIGGRKVSWHFRLACFDLQDGNVGMYLIMDHEPDRSIDFEMKCRFACIDEFRDEVHRREGFMQFEPDKLCLGFRNFVHHSHILIPKSNIIMRGTLYVTCTLYSTSGPDEYYSSEWIDTVLGEDTSISNSIVCHESLWLIPPCMSHRSDIDQLHNATTEMLHTMYTLGLFADVKVTCGDKIFNLHKSVLSAWSEVFLAMFSSPMIEREGDLNITDCSEVTFENLVRYLYSEQIPDTEGEVTDLLIIADKYLISRLKRRCEEVMIEYMQVHNIAELAELATKHGCQLLKNKLVNFIKDNREELSYDEDLKDILIGDPDMLWRLSILERKGKSL